MRKPGRRAGMVFAATCCFATLGAGIAWAADTIVANDSLGYQSPTFAMDQGERPTFQNNELGEPHDVTASGKIAGAVLFSSPTITGVSSAAVNGTQYLTPGSYPFFCSVHLDMKGTLIVSSNGAPVARPRIDVSFVTKTLAKVQRSGKVVLRVKALTHSDDASVALKLGKRQIGVKRNLDLEAGSVRRVTMVLSNSNRNRFDGVDKAKVKAIGSVPFGQTNAASKLLK